MKINLNSLCSKCDKPKYNEIEGWYYSVLGVGVTSGRLPNNGDMSHPIICKECFKKLENRTGWEPISEN